jgi:tetratricopeptide (TPR) repeat protein
MSNRNTIFLLTSLFIVIVTTSLLVRFNDKKANYAPPTFVGDSIKHNDKIQLADLAYSKKEYKKALELYREILASYPDNFPLLHKMGQIQIQLRLFKDAEKNYLSLTTKAPDNALFHASLALISLELNKLEQALTAADKAILLKAKDGLPFLVKAATYAQQMDVSKSLDEFKHISPTPFLVKFIQRKNFDPIRQEKEFIAFSKHLHTLFPAAK